MGGVTLGKAHYKHRSTSPACAVLTELRNRDGIKVVTNYAGLPYTREETKVSCPQKFQLQTRPCTYTQDSHIVTNSESFIEHCVNGLTADCL